MDSTYSKDPAVSLTCFYPIIRPNRVPQFSIPDHDRPQASSTDLRIPTTNPTGTIQRNKKNEHIEVLGMEGHSWPSHLVPSTFLPGTSGSLITRHPVTAGHNFSTESFTFTTQLYRVSATARNMPNVLAGFVRWSKLDPAWLLPSTPL